MLIYLVANKLWDKEPLHTFLPSVPYMPYIHVTQNFVRDDLIGCRI